MKQKIGILESVKNVGIIFGDLEIAVDGQKFYNRIRCRDMPRKMKDLIRKEIKTDYEEITTVLTDWIMDRIFFVCFKIPRHYNQIRAIELVYDLTCQKKM